MLLTYLSQLGGWTLFQAGERAQDVPLNYLLPTLAYTFGSWALMSRLVRNRLVEVGAQAFMQTARAKGLSAGQALRKHGLPHAWALIATLLGGSLPGLLVGSVVIEYVFNIEGMGTLILNAVKLGDVPVMMGIFMLSAVLTVLGYLLTDVLYRFIHPQLLRSR